MTIQPAGRTLLRRAVVIGALGVVFGDIGSSPIYTFRECLKSSGNAGNVCFVMGADNDGEGGIIALLGLASAVELDEGRQCWLVLIWGARAPRCSKRWHAAASQFRASRLRSAPKLPE